MTDDVFGISYPLFLKSFIVVCLMFFSFNTFLGSGVKLSSGPKAQGLLAVEELPVIGVTTHSDILFMASTSSYTSSSLLLDLSTFYLLHIMNLRLLVLIHIFLDLPSNLT